MSRSEWHETARKSAAASYGHEMRHWYAFRTLAAVPLGIGLAVAAVGYGCYWVWTRVTDAFAAGGSLPAVFWLVAALLLIATLVAYRPRILPSSAMVLVLKGLVFGAAWLALLAYGFGLL